MKLTRPRVLVLLLLFHLGAWAALLGAGRIFESPNYSLIEKGLYLGGFVDKPPPRTSAVLNLCELKNRYTVEVLRWEPVPDREPAPDLAWLRRMVDFLDEQKAAGRTTYVHCRNGASRSGMVVTAYYMSKKGWTRDETLKFLRTKRPEVRPNPAFMDRLLEWEKELREPKKMK